MAKLAQRALEAEAKAEGGSSATPLDVLHAMVQA
jgi:hypothetical protein